MEIEQLVKEIVKAGEKRDKNKLPELFFYLSHKDGNVRRLTCSALGKIGSPLAERPLIGMLADEKPQVRQYAIKALGKVGTKYALPILTKISEDRKEKEYNRTAARIAATHISKGLGKTSKTKKPSPQLKPRTPSIELNPEFRQALRLMEKTRKNVFVTGRAGTGKSTLLTYFRDHAKKDVAVLAPTGVAAVNIQGQTIHSFFGFKPDITVDVIRKKYRRHSRRGLYKKLDAIVIDEISMVRADLLDCIDEFLRLNGPNKKLPFGGIQMIFIGDLYQLPPVVTREAKMLFKTVYQSPYFFDAKVMESFKMEMVFLEKIYRQEDEKFIRILNAVRNRSVTDEDLEFINTRNDPRFEPPGDDFYIYLTTTNAQAHTINEQYLSGLRTPVFKHRGWIEGDFDEKALPTNVDLQIKVGAQIMLVNNDREGRWINGTVGKIVDFEEDEDSTIIWVELASGEEVGVVPYTWEMFRFFLSPKTGRLDSEVVGSFTQYPLMLAWAITIHKSQGKTFDKVILDIGRGTFAHGQAYVALSRCTALEGLVLKKPLQKKHILMDWRVVKFLTGFQYQKADEKMAVKDKIALIKGAIKEGRSLRIVYLKSDDERSKRVVKPLEVGKAEYTDKEFIGMRAFCRSRQEERMFRVDRILEIEEV